eukprot:jgi/Botrbrau1/17361/Bobra.0015s0102.1
MQQYSSLNQAAQVSSGGPLPAGRPGQASQAQGPATGPLSTHVPHSAVAEPPSVPSQSQGAASSQQGQMQAAGAAMYALPSSSTALNPHPPRPVPAGGAAAIPLPATLSRGTSQAQPSGQVVPPTSSGQTHTLAQPQGPVCTAQGSGARHSGAADGLQNPVPGSVSNQSTAGQPSQVAVPASGVQVVPMPPQGPASWGPQAVPSNLTQSNPLAGRPAAVDPATSSALSNTEGIMQTRGGPLWATSGMAQAVGSFTGALNPNPVASVGPAAGATEQGPGMPSEQGPGSSGSEAILPLQSDQGQPSSSWQGPASSTGSGLGTSSQGVSLPMAGMRPPHSAQA